MGAGNLGETDRERTVAVGDTYEKGCNKQKFCGDIYDGLTTRLNKR
jgi:hypothetical protein